MEENEDRCVIPRAKLEVLTAKQVNWLLSINLVAIGYASFYRVSIFILTNTMLLKEETIRTDTGVLLTLRGVNGKHAIWGPLQVFDHTCRLLTCLCLMILASLFTQRLIRSREKYSITSEQVWVMILLWCAVIYLNPIMPIGFIQFYISANYGGMPWYFNPRFEKTYFFFQEMHYQSFVATSLFYTWAMLQSFSMLSTVNRMATVRFYLPKIALILFYMIYRQFLAELEALSITPAYVPLASFVNMIFDCIISKNYPLRIILSVVGLTVIELVIISAMVRTFLRTSRTLQSADYMKQRTKIVGFRFFVFQNLLFYTWTISIRILAIFIEPPLIRIQTQVAPFLVRRSFLYNKTTWQSGDDFVLLLYCFTTAYIYLPPDSVGIRGWFTGAVDDELNSGTASVTSVSYSIDEPAAPDCNCFVMDVNATLFNLSWLVYEWNTKKHDSAKSVMSRAGLDWLMKGQHIKHIEDKESDTHAVLLALPTRILISFRGTSSKENMKTDIKMSYINLLNVLPSYVSDSTTERDSSFSSFSMKRARIHKGFAKAYLSVSDRIIEMVSMLLEEKKRPVYVTGHSLGASLATLCSLDLVWSLPHIVENNSVRVYSYGSPKVGNWAWRIVYDEHIFNHWRVSVAPDLVTMLPKFGGYRHVGKNVTFTTAGRILLDPDSLEYTLWSQEGASVAFHKKQSYLLCFHSFVHRYHGSEQNVPLWPFPVTPDEVSKWEEACAVKLPIEHEFGIEEYEEKEDLSLDEIALDIAPMSLNDFSRKATARSVTKKSNRVTISSKTYRDLMLGKADEQTLW